MDEVEESLIKYLILNGALQMSGVSDDGEILYSFTPKLKEVMPDLYEIHNNKVNSDVMRLWERGFVNLDLFAESPMVTLTEKAFDFTEISKLSEEDQFSIIEIKRVLLSE